MEGISVTRQKNKHKIKAFPLAITDLLPWLIMLPLALLLNALNWEFCNSDRPDFCNSVYFSIIRRCEAKLIRRCEAKVYKDRNIWPQPWKRLG